MTGAHNLDWRRWGAAALLIAYACEVALAHGVLKWALAAALVLAPMLAWILYAADAWLILFFAAALLAPPLPLNFGNSGPHPSLAFAALGLGVGVVRLNEWRFHRGLLEGALVTFLAVLAISVACAAIYSGEDVAIQSLARVGLAGISIFVFFYVSAGPGRATSISLQLLFWVALASASFACLDFYFQFPAPAGFEAQYVWLASGIYRRAQGLFYEASTLANFCAFFLVMIAVALVRRVANRPLLLSAGVVFASALIFSYSRAAVLGVGVALTTLLLLERTHLAFRRLVWIVAGALAAGLAIVYQVFPRFAEAYWSRISYAATNFSSSADRILTGRVESWQTLIGFLAENPWHAIFGVGYKTLPYSDFIGQRVVSDNMYLSALVETGIVGLGALLVLNFAILRAGYTAARSSDSEKSFYGTWIFCFWTAQMVQMLSADVLTFWRVMPVSLWVLAMAVRKRVPL